MAEELFQSHAIDKAFELDSFCSGVYELNTFQPIADASVVRIQLGHQPTGWQHQYLVVHLALQNRTGALEIHRRGLIRGSHSFEGAPANAVILRPPGYKCQHVAADIKAKPGLPLPTFRNVCLLLWLTSQASGKYRLTSDNCYYFSTSAFALICRAHDLTFPQGNVLNAQGKPKSTNFNLLTWMFSLLHSAPVIAKRQFMAVLDRYWQVSSNDGHVS